MLFEKDGYKNYLKMTNSKSSQPEEFVLSEPTSILTDSTKKAQSVQRVRRNVAA